MALPLRGRQVCSPYRRLIASVHHSSIYAAQYYVKFNTVFTANKYKLNTTKYSQVFYNYTNGNCIHEQVKTLPDNNITKNYTLRQ